jgi:ubiquinone/menaquinone biosynthesis C-methylase UbiE
MDELPEPLPVSTLDSTARFSDRVDDYVRFRPDYPKALMAWLQAEQGFASGSEVADIGAGTGISSKMLLDAGCRVIAVEPNAPMRAAAEHWLGDHAGFEAVDGRADATGLADASVDRVTVAQAFHWFDPRTTRREFARILRPGGRAAVWWNSRRLAGTPFLEGYEALLQRWGTDYVSVAERYADDAWMREWFGNGFAGSASFPHSQRLDVEALRGRLMSSSYVPKPGDARHEPMLQALYELFER